MKKESIVKKEIESDMEIDQDGTIEPFFAPIRQKISLLDLWNKFKDPEKPLFKKKPRMAFLLVRPLPSPPPFESFAFLLKREF